MNITIRHISHLLRDRDDLAVPGLGVFRRRRVSARFDGDILMPPSEELVFIAHDGGSDDVLVKSVARSLACDISSAADRVNADIADVKARLEAGQTVGLDGMGRLVAAPALGGIVFEASAACTRLLPSSWLQPIEQLVELEQVTDVKYDEETEKRRNIFVQSLQRTASSAAAIALLALIAFVASQLPRKGNPEPQMASFGFERVERSSVTEPLGEPAADKALVLILNTPADGMCIVDPAEKNSGNIVGRNPDDSHFLIVASFATAGDAREFIAGHSDTPSLGILETEGRCRVYAASGDSFSTVKTKAENAGLLERFPTAWICRK